MTDAHCHISGGDASVREFLIGRDFIGLHPWDVGKLVYSNSILSGDSFISPDSLGQLESLERQEDSGISDIKDDRGQSPSEVRKTKWSHQLESLERQEDSGILDIKDDRGQSPSEVRKTKWDHQLNFLKETIEKRLSENSKLGVGEIGLDRLKEREISNEMREAFDVQFQLALAFNRPVVLHGAKCWGQVVAAVQRSLAAAHGAATSRSLAAAHGGATSRALCARPATGVPSLLFHGFSRSDGLIPDIVKLNGYISVGPAVLNDHAVNYRAMVKKIPLDRLLVETDRTLENAATCPPLAAVLAKTAELRGLSSSELERITDANASAFIEQTR